MANHEKVTWECRLSPPGLQPIDILITGVPGDIQKEAVQTALIRAGKWDKENRHTLHRQKDGEPKLKHTESWPWQELLDKGVGNNSLTEREVGKTPKS